MFRAPKRTLGDLSAETAAKLIAAASDIALIVDAKGVIRDVAFGSDELAKEGYENWVGRPWVETVTVESRPKIEELLSEAASAKAKLRWRQVNHPSKRGPDVPVHYAAVQIGTNGRIVAVGRDFRTVSALQQRLVDAQQSMEREYARLRHAETRYRLLFQIASEPVLIVDATTLKVVEANPAASTLLGKTSKRLSGRTFLDLFTPEGAKAVQILLNSVRTTGRAEEIATKLQDGKRESTVSASLFRQDRASHFLIRLSSLADTATPNTTAKLFSVIENLPDGFVVTDLDRRIMTANPAFLDLAQLATEEQARGELLEKWVGRPGVDVTALVANIAEHGAVRHFNTVVRGEYGTNEDVEISAVSVLNGEQPCYGFTIRVAGRREAPKPRNKRELPRSVEQLMGLVGRMTLKEIVTETTDVIEKLCIEAALELTGNNRASAAEMLGLSRQSLYSKLRRYGIGDYETGDDGDD